MRQAHYVIRIWSISNTSARQFMWMWKYFENSYPVLNQLISASWSKWSILFQAMWAISISAYNHPMPHEAIRPLDGRNAHSLPEVPPGFLKSNYRQFPSIHLHFFRMLSPQHKTHRPHSLNSRPLKKRHRLPVGFQTWEKFRCCRRSRKTQPNYYGDQTK